MALSIEKWGLHQRLALGIIKRTGSRSRSIVLGFILATALLSMWISNTATTLMLLPIALAMLKELDRNGSQSANGPFAQALLLGIAYSASIGGTATLIGTPTNLIFAAASDELLGRSVSFFEWTRQALPLALAALILCWLYLTRWKFRFEDRDQPELKKIVQQKLDALGPLSKQELKVLLVFSAVVVLWIGRTLLLQDLLPGLSDPAIALGGALILFILPSDRSKGRILEWSDMKELPWGILILFGGGLSLAAAFQSTGLATWLADRFLFLEGVPPLLILGSFWWPLNFTTELTSMWPRLCFDAGTGLARFQPRDGFVFAHVRLRGHLFLCLHAPRGHCTQCRGLQFGSDPHWQYGANRSLAESAQYRTDQCVSLPLSGALNKKTLPRQG